MRRKGEKNGGISGRDGLHLISRYGLTVEK